MRPRAWSEIARSATLLAVTTALAPSPVLADPSELFMLRGLLDAEYFNTDAGSRLLAVNEGDAAGGARLRLFAGGDFTHGLQGYVVGEIEGGDATGEGQTETELEQMFLRYSHDGSAPFRVDAGKIVTPVGDFSRRYLSNVNPLIGQPSAYSVDYPVGIVVSGRVKMFDYRAGAIDRPIVNEAYVPAYDTAYRPVLAAGITPTIGLRIGTYVTQGSYLGSEVDPYLPAGQRWQDFDQTIVGVEGEYSRGHFELHADFAYSRTEVPLQSEDCPGQAWYVEPKYTWTPRFFTALRFERNDYTYVEPLSEFFWIASNALFYDLELGAGWRFSPELLLKASYRVDRWKVDDSLRELLPDGQAFAVQLSYSFNVNDWLERPQ